MTSPILQFSRAVLPQLGGFGRQFARGISSSSAAQHAEAQPAVEVASQQSSNVQARWISELGVIRTDWT